MKKESDSGLSEGDLHLASGEGGVVKDRNGSEAIFDAKELHKGHIFV